MAALKYVIVNKMDPEILKKECMDKSGNNVCSQKFEEILSLIDMNNECPLLYWAEWLPYTKSGFLTYGYKPVVAKRMQLVISLLNQAMIVNLYVSDDIDNIQNKYQTAL